MLTPTKNGSALPSLCQISFSAQRLAKAVVSTDPTLAIVLWVSDGGCLDGTVIKLPVKFEEHSGKEEGRGDAHPSRSNEVSQCLAWKRLNNCLLSIVPLLIPAVGLSCSSLWFVRGNITA